SSCPSEREIGADLADLLRAEGHDEVAFTIVGSGPNGASPHHEAGDRRIADGDTIVLDFGGAMSGYRSDITRTVHVGGTIGREEQKVHDVVRHSQEAGYAAARTDASAESVDAAARRVIVQIVPYQRLDLWIGAGAALALLYIGFAAFGAGFFAGRRTVLAGALSVLVGAFLYAIVAALTHPGGDPGAFASFFLRIPVAVF